MYMQRVSPPCALAIRDVLWGGRRLNRTDSGAHEHTVVFNEGERLATHTIPGAETELQRVPCFQMIKTRFRKCAYKAQLTRGVPHKVAREGVPRP